MKLLLLWVSVGCNSPSEPASAPEEAPREIAPVAPSAESMALARANELITSAQSRLQARMAQEMNRRGPSEAVESCSIEAEALTVEGSHPEPEQSGIPGERIGRSSLKLRNLHNGAPDWVARWLAEMGDRSYQGVEGIEQVVEVEGYRVARVLRPIPVEPRCLTCHGPSENIPADVRAVLDARYPEDQAKGYDAGDLRGALWAEVPVKP